MAEQEEIDPQYLCKSTLPLLDFGRSLTKAGILPRHLKLKTDVRQQLEDTQFFLFDVGGWFSALAAGTLAFGFAFTLFEIFVSFLQAYVFAILTAVYIQLAVAEEH